MFLKRVFGGRVATLKVTSAAKAFFLNGQIVKFKLNILVDRKTHKGL